MSFFHTNPPSDESGSNGSTGSDASSNKSQPLFRQNDALPDTLAGAGEHISLSAYISRHLQGGSANEDLPETAAPESIAPRIGFPTPERRVKARPSGLFLNSLDVDMPAGLEQYLPSPIFRLRIAKKRLDGEINELRMRINKYDRLPDKAPALQEQVILLKHRLATLEKHQREISQQLSANLGVVPALYALSQQGSGFGEWINRGIAAIRQFMLTLMYGDAYQQVQTDNEEMVYLKELYAERMKSGTFDEAELSAIINRFEQVAQRSEADARKLKPISLPKRLWQEAKGLVK